MDIHELLETLSPEELATPAGAVIGTLGMLLGPLMESATPEEIREVSLTAAALCLMLSDQPVEVAELEAARAGVLARLEQTRTLPPGADPSE